MAHGAFSPTRAWRPAVVARLARTLGVTTHSSVHTPYENQKMQIPLGTTVVVRLVLPLLMLIPTQALLAHDLPTHDAMKAAPEHHKLLLENDSVRVLETRIRPGERTAVHSHPWPAVQYLVSFSDFIRYDPEGKVLFDSRNMATKPPPGAALWSPPVPLHYIQNVGSGDLLVIAVELKPK